MWRKLHVLGPVQSFVVASLSAASIALSFALQSVSHNEAALFRNVFWPDRLSPYLTFSLVFIGVVPALLGYYHLGRLGFLVNVAAGFALAWIMMVCWVLCFLYVGHYFGSIWLSTVAFGACVALVYLFIARLHLRAAGSASTRDAQRKLRLLPLEQ